MRRARSFVFLMSICLTLGACQTPLPANLPGKIQASNVPLDEAAYSEAFVKIYDNYTAESREATQAAPPSLQNFAVPGRVATAPTEAPSAGLQLPENGDASGEGSSSQGATPPAALLPEHYDLMITLLQGQSQSLDKMQAELKALQAPPSFAEKHALLLEFFELSAKMTQALLAHIEKSGPEVLQQNPLDVLEAEQKADFERLQAIQAEAQEIMAELQIEVYYHLRLQQQGPERLSQEAYLQQLKAQFPRLTSLSPMLLVMSGLTAPPSEASTAENLGFMQRLQAQNQDKLDGIAKMNPPEAYAKGHTSLFALLHLQGQMLDMMAEVLEESGQSDTRSPQLLLAKLLSRPAFFTLMSKITVLTPVFTDWVGSFPAEAEPVLEVPEAETTEA